MHDTSFSLPRHPLGIKPAGNVYTNTKTLRGPFLQLPDEIIVQILEFLCPKDLHRIGSTCRALFAFSRLDELWKTFGVDCPPEDFEWRGTWYASFIGLDTPVRISVDDLASDVLYRPFLCAHTPLQPYPTSIPKANAIARLPDLTVEEFSKAWTDTPFILREPVKQWPVYQDWSQDALLQKYKDVIFRAEAVDWSLSKYVEYMNDNIDESPVYLFDRAFAEKMEIKVGHGGDYWSPDCFGQDLFQVLGDQRPDHRWLIIGPERSGSTFHKDPNATSAWNAVLSGSKYWIMFPSGPQHPPPPGVFVSEDQSEVTSPLSIAEWLLGFHAEARATPGCIEAICSQGEILHVPSGWWHLVVNLAPSVAITQNFVPEAHLVNALSFLKHKPDQVSGFSQEVQNPYGLFKERLEESCPNILENVLQKSERSGTVKKRRWTEMANGHEKHDDGPRKSNNDSNSFSFGFGDDEDADVP